MENIFTKDNITFLLGLIGSIGTAITFIKSLIDNRLNFSIKAISFNIGANGILTYLMFINNSNKPLTITSISINANGIYCPCDLISKEVIHTVRKSGKVITGTHSEYSMSFPIVLSGQFSTSGYVYFPLPKDISVHSSRLWSLKVCTSKNKALEKILELNAHH